MKFGDNLRTIRKSKNMSQEDLAERINISRQSVSKWENGESYPEMNNILKLCEIFDCKINDLIHNDISDIYLLGEEVIDKTKGFNEKKQNNLKILSNIISLIGKIGSIVLLVFIPFILLVMLIIPYVISSVHIDGNSLSFKDDNIKIVDNKIEIYDAIIMEIDNDNSLEEIIKVFKNNDTYKIIIYLELAFTFVLLTLIIMIMIFKNVEHLFNNIKSNDTPFILENGSLIRKISYLMLALIVFESLSNLLFNFLIVNNYDNKEIELVSILQILIIFSVAYVFDYGYEIQKDSKRKIYTLKK